MNNSISKFLMSVAISAAILMMATGCGEEAEREYEYEEDSYLGPIPKVQQVLE